MERAATVNGATLLRADALRLPLRDRSVDLIITSPPYFALRSYQDGGEHYGGQIGSEPTPDAFLAALWAVSDECWRVLKPTGSMFVNLGDKYAGSGGHNNSGLNTEKYMRGHNWDETRDAPKSYNKASDVPAKSLMGLPWRYALGLTCPMTYRTDLYDGQFAQWTLRAEIVWSKPNGLPESVTDRVRRSHEQWFHFTKQGRYYAAVDEVREAYSAEASERRTKYGRLYADGYATGNRNDADRGGPMGKGGASENPLGKLPGSVWTIPSEPLAVPEHLGVDHFAAFPTEWPRRLILGWSPSGICVKCGEGRVPVVEKDRSVVDYDLAEQRATERVDATGGAVSGGVKRSTLGHALEATITGYRCACDVPLAATRPAVALDPFAGTGTVPLVARTLGRYGIGVDLSRDYLRLANWRVFGSGHGRKAEARTNRERQGELW